MTALLCALIQSVSHLLPHTQTTCIFSKKQHTLSLLSFYFLSFFVPGAYNTNTSLIHPLGLLRVCEVWQGPTTGLFPLLLAFSTIPFSPGLSTTYFYTLPTCLSCFCKQQRHPVYVNQLFCTGGRRKRWIQGTVQRWQVALHLPWLFNTNNTKLSK